MIAPVRRSSVSKRLSSTGTELRALRAFLSAQIAHAIDLLDAIDGDPDFEPEPLEEQHDVEDVSHHMFGGQGA